MAEEMSRADKRYGGKAKADERKGEEKATEHKAEDRHDEREGADRHADSMREMFKRHQKEHRDLHGTHREAMSKMMARHEAEMKSAHQNMAPDGGQPEMGPPGDEGEGGEA